MSTFTVTEIAGQREWAPADDQTKKTVFWTFRADEVDKPCSIGRKPGNDLKVGEVIEATASDDGRGGLKLKKVQQQAFGGGFRPDPAKDRRITRMASQERALRYMVAKGITDFKLDDDFRKVIDWFAKDADAAGQA